MKTAQEIASGKVEDVSITRTSTGSIELFSLQSLEVVNIVFTTLLAVDSIFEKIAKCRAWTLFSTLPSVFFCSTSKGTSRGCMKKQRCHHGLSWPCLVLVRTMRWFTPTRYCHVIHYHWPTIVTDLLLSFIFCCRQFQITPTTLCWILWKCTLTLKRCKTSKCLARGPSGS